MKTKMIKIDIHSHVNAPISVGQQYIDDVDHFTNPGSVVTNTDNPVVDVKYRIGKVAVVFSKCDEYGHQKQSVLP